MIYYIAIDGGTSNTRFTLICDNIIVCRMKREFGAGSFSSGVKYKENIKNSISDLLSQNHLTESDIEAIIASGMITSELGLIYLPYVDTPVNLETLHNNLKTTILKDITSIPFSFVCGVRTLSKETGLADIMRGEETELMGLLSSETGEYVYILPGSHSKIITIINGCIVDFTSMLSGEMIAALSQHTILRSSVMLNEVNLDEEYLYRGYEYCTQCGINNALFKIRVLDKQHKKDKNQRYSFFLGVVLQAEIEYILSLNCKKIFIGGKEQIRHPMQLLLQRYCKTPVEEIEQNTSELATVIGAKRIYNGYFD